MALADPREIDPRPLFRDEDMFDSRSAWSAAGFDLIARSNSGKIMVARHPSVQGLLFKKYTSDVDESAQTENFRRRLEGADELRRFVSDEQLSRIAVPRKWIVKLPRPFSRRQTTHILVVEQLALLTEDQTKAAYRNIDAALLRELCIVLFHFRGLDSIAKNMPFIADGRIGFVDTEHWDRSTSKSYLYRVGEFLTKEQRKLAKKILGRLDGDDP